MRTQHRFLWIMTKHRIKKAQINIVYIEDSIWTSSLDGFMVCQLIEMFICLERIEWRKYNVNDYDRLRFCLMMSWWTRVHSSLSLYGPWYGRGGQRCWCQYEENCDVTWHVSNCWPAGVGRHGAGSRVTCHAALYITRAVYLQRDVLGTAGWRPLAGRWWAV